MKEKMNSFSVALGLFDYINPIFYTITSFTIMVNLYGLMATPLFVVYALGALISLIFGFSIPTVKLLVGLGKFSFKMPVNLVSYVNCGILLSGITLFTYVYNLNTWKFILMLAIILLFLALIYSKAKKFNTVAVLIGAIGYILIYTSLITLAVKLSVIISIVLYVLAICLFAFLLVVGITWNLKDPKVHWVIEICNVVCQFSVALGTLLLFTI